MDPIKNLISLIQEKLQKIPLALRQKVYSYGAILAAIYTVWVAANGDWNVFWKSLIATVIGVLARANATSNDPDGSEPDLEDIDGETLDESAPQGNFVTDSAGTWNADDIGDPTPAGDSATPLAVIGIDRYGNTVTGE